MKTRWWGWMFFFFTLNSISSSGSEDNPVRLTFSGNSEEENQISILGAGFDSFPRGTLTFGPIPTENAFPGATDGRGAVISCAPGQGLMIFTPVVESAGALFVRCSVRADGPQGAIALATIDQGANTFVATNTPNNGAYFHNQYKRLALLSLPAAGGIQSLIQIVNPSATETLTVYLDNFEIWPLDPQRYYSAEFMDGDEDDPQEISTGLLIDPRATATPEREAATPTPTLETAPTNSPISTPTVRNTATPTPTLLPFQGFLSITGKITNSDNGSAVEGAAIYIDGFPDSRSESFFGGIYVIFAILYNTTPPYTLVVEKDGFQRYEKRLTAENLAASLTLDVALTPIGSSTPVPGSTPTPTPTIILFPTSTRTPTPSGSAVGLRLTACYPYGGAPVSRGIQVIVDLIDADGQIVNPGTEGGDAPQTVTVSVNGSANFTGGDIQNIQSTDVRIDNPLGGNVTIYNRQTEKVTVTAEAPHLQPAAPIQVEFIDTGLITGKLRVWDGEAYIDPSVAFNLDIDAYNANTTHYFSPLFFYRNGQYTIGGLAPGTYSIRFNPQENLLIPIQGDPPGESLEWKCFNNVVVRAREITTLDVDLGPRKPGGRIEGILVRSDGKPVRSGVIHLFSTDYILGQPLGNCDSKYFQRIITNTSADPNFEAKFEFPNIPSGTYTILAMETEYDIQVRELFYFHNGYGETVHVTVGQTAEVVVELDRGGTITPLSPLNFARLNSPPVFEWAIHGNNLWANLRLSVLDRCGQQVWSQGVNGSPVRYNGPALSHQTMYFWYVYPDFPNALYSGAVSYTAGTPYFLVKKN
ncbi:MAG TPA: carboxypeptidase-like regulatory domain-containing protein [bacterium]|nr:carboxypeptidase-like regulatory domain-containing protein [bacterium]HPO99363.1 carboxypeptidase-like regulatory domain-containing protein [bacterium]